ncbi:hypothetical protein K505DRAFT_251253 [Melanomma pulvis-pyrius CBS 109.77]|uniref:Uncharacterized protein n=1 Tax=Melanomma pulvis-pyrius CBS 109.77 TaxID=1314802 RepID=A0A6A6X1M5_9PLEO|nr:hypothetical protein K505DRAFT_251253 [Melanomma pulvis-pyrius CBS 109.77]
MLKPRSRTFQEIEDDEWNHCGRSSQHAMDKGCVMEPLFYGWMPSKCVFPELTDQFPVFEDRTWYQDENLTQVIAPEDLYRGKHNIIWTEKYHDEHCLFQWRKLQYGMHHRKEFLDNKTISMHHSKHCSDQLSANCEPGKETGYRNIVELGFYRCRKTVFLSQ